MEIVHIPVCSPLSGKHSRMNVVDVVVLAIPDVAQIHDDSRRPPGPCRPTTGLRPRRNVVGEDLAIWPRRRSSTASVVPRGIMHIWYTRRPSGLQTRRAAERTWIRNNLRRKSLGNCIRYMNNLCT